MEIIFATEKFKSLVALLIKVTRLRKATSVSTRSFPQPKTIEINWKMFLHVFVWGFPSFLLAEEYLNKITATCSTEKYQLVILCRRARYLKASVILFKRVRPKKR